MPSIHRGLTSFLCVGLIVGLLPGIGFAQGLPRNAMSEAYWKLWKPQNQIAYLEELDTLKRPIHLSEITIPAPGADARANAIQAVIARNMYRLWFSWPSIYRITWWNIVDDCGAPGEPTTSGLFTRQMEPKPAFHALNKLINDEWKTRTTVKADGDGIVAFRGFRDRYRLTWTDADRTGNKVLWRFPLFGVQFPSTSTIGDQNRAAGRRMWRPILGQSRIQTAKREFDSPRCFMANCRSIKGSF